jgi:type VI secretion system secreted protein Hcp
MGEMFLRLDGIQGESLDEGSSFNPHKREIEIVDWNWKIDNTAPYAMNHAQQSTKIDVQHIEVTKICDIATAALVKHCTLGTHIPEGQITCRKKAGDTKIQYLIVVLKDVMVKTVNWTGKGTDHLVQEIITLSFSEFEIRYKLQLNSGHLSHSEGGGTEVPGTASFGFNIQTHQQKSG